MQIRLAFATDQVLILDQMRTKALASDATGAVGSLDYVMAYYPSGTKLPPGSGLDLIVERYRATVADDIIGHLRSITGADYGTGPEDWIRRVREDQLNKRT
jgi:hypothetical protein